MSCACVRGHCVLTDEELRVRRPRKQLSASAWREAGTMMLIARKRKRKTVRAKKQETKSRQITVMMMKAQEAP